MNARQKLFVEEYLKDMNATQAAIRAGYSEKTAYSQGQRLLKNVEIKNGIKKLREKLQDENIATIKDIEEFLSLSMNGEIDEEVVLTIGTGEGYTELVKERRQISTKDRIRAADLLLRRFALSGDSEDAKRLSKAQADKATAEARLAESKAEALENMGVGVELVIVDEWSDEDEEVTS